MDSSIIMMLILQVVLIFLNAFFACAEIALISVNENKMEKMAEGGNKKAALLVKMNTQPARFLATIQVAITLSGFLASAFAADNFAGPLVRMLRQTGMPVPDNILHTMVVIVITLVLSYFTLVFGELVPKQIAMRKAESLALGIAGIIYGLSRLFGPVVGALTVSTNLVLKILGIEAGSEDEDVSEDEIRLMVDIGSEKGTIADEEREFIENVFEFDDLTLDELVTHRLSVVMLNADDPAEIWEETIFNSRHTLYPVWKESQDNIIGILNIKDYFRLKNKSKEEIMEKAVTNAYYVPETLKADILFKNMKKEKQVMAVVLDEYGGMTGIITMNDLVEELVGELINDTCEDERILQIDENTWKIQGNTHLDRIAQQLHISFEEEEYDTLSGLIFHNLGNIPEDQSDIEMEMNGLCMRISEIKNHKIKNVIVSKIK